jgi:tyrosyl-tRNA synthetase
VCLIIGDFTGRIGDPTGKSETRKQLTEEEVQRNAETYRQQLFIILDPQKTTMYLNSDWLGKLTFSDVIKLAAKYTVARMLERDDFRNRFKEERPIAVHEFMYPLAQAYDSVAIHADIELGGTDQTFNLLVGRDIQAEYGQPRQIVMTLPLLEGTDGVQKMSKSIGNYIGITETPKEMFGKTMSIADTLIAKYFELCTSVSMDEIRSMQAQMAEGKLNPRDAKMKLGRELVRIYHGEEAAQAAQDEFIRVFSQKELPDDIPEWAPAEGDAVGGAMPVVRLLVASGLVSSNGEARRLIAQGGVRVDDVKVENDTDSIALKSGTIIRVGKRKYVKIR